MRGIWLSILGAFLLQGVVLAEDRRPVEEEARPTGERPRIQYWLRDPVGTQEAKPGSIRSEETKPTPVAYPVTDRVEKKVVRAEPVGDLDEQAELAIEKRRAGMRAYFIKMLEKAKTAYKVGDYDRCVSICRNVLTADPRNTEAVKILGKAHSKQADADEAVTRAAAERKNREATLESEIHSVRPPVRMPETRPYWPRRKDDPAIPNRKKMKERMEQRVTVDFMNADLDWVLNTLFILTGINIIADPTSVEDKQLTLHVEDLPLRSVLDFIVRNNEGIQYSVTEDAVWITASESSDLKKIMIPRIYPIHHGLTSATSGGGSNRQGSSARAPGGGRGGSGGGGGGNRGSGGSSGGANSGQESYLETVLQWLQDQADPQTFPDGSQWLVDRKTNNLVVFTTPAGHENLQQFLDAFDQPPIQVLIKARFLDVSLEDNKALGVDLQRVNITDIKALNPFTFLGNTPTNLAGTLGLGSSLAITGNRTDPQFALTMNALLNNRKTKILSEPQILAINNKESFINISTQFSFITDLREVTGTSFGGDGTATQDTIAFVPEFDTDEIGFTLRVTPSVGRDLKTINLHIAPIIDSLAQGQNISDFQQFDVVDSNNAGSAVPPTIQRPTIDQTELETDVVLEDNGYVILGGLIRNRWETFERKIPGLHRIPWLGHLFKSKSRNKTTSNLMIILEAQIITPRGRTYRTAPNPDDGDIREGGVNRAPGQVSEVYRPRAVTKALGLPNQDQVSERAKPYKNPLVVERPRYQKNPLIVERPRRRNVIYGQKQDPKPAPKTRVAQLVPAKPVPVAQPVSMASRKRSAPQQTRNQWSVSEEESGESIPFKKKRSVSNTVETVIMRNGRPVRQIRVINPNVKATVVTP